MINGRRQDHGFERAHIEVSNNLAYPLKPQYKALDVFGGISYVFQQLVKASYMSNSESNVFKL